MQLIGTTAKTGAFTKLYLIAGFIVLLLSNSYFIANVNANSNLLLDINSNAAAAYSLRKLRSSYTGSAIRIRRDSDNAETDIGFDMNGDLDVDAIESFLGIESSLPGDSAPLVVGYSLRKIRDAYTGPAIRVRRDSDDAEMDIGFDSNGNLDEAAIDAFVNSTYTDTLPLDTAVAAGAYGLRQLGSSYSGPLIRVRRDSDDTEMDIGFLSSGLLDTVTLLGFCGTDTCYVHTWYDQSGNGFDADQTTDANQPRIVNSGTLDVDSTDMPAIFFEEARNTRLDGAFQDVPDLISFIYLFEPTNIADTTQAMLEINPGTIGNQGASSFYATSRYNFRVRADGTLTEARVTTSLDAKPMIMNCYYEGGSPIAANLQPDNISDVRNTTTALDNTISAVVIGNMDTHATYHLTGYMSEILIYPNIQDSNQAALNGNIQEVHSMVTGVNAYVTTWYDQSANGFDIIAPANTNQPKIYDGVTGFELDNDGNTTVHFDGTDDVMIVDTAAVNSAIRLQAGSQSNYVFYQLFDPATVNSGSGFLSSRDILESPGDDKWKLGYGNSGGYFWVQNKIGANAHEQRSRTGAEISTTFNQVNLLASKVICDGSSDLDMHVKLNNSASQSTTGIAMNAALATDLELNHGLVLGAKDLSDSHSDIKFREAMLLDADLDLDNNVIRDNINDTYGLVAGVNAYVATWYDQSGTNNNATQAIQAAQPKIYDSNTGLITGANSKAALDFDGVDDWLDLNDNIFLLENSSSFVLAQASSVPATTGMMLSARETNRWRAPELSPGAIWTYRVGSSAAIADTLDLNWNLHTMITNTEELFVYRNSNVVGVSPQTDSGSLTSLNIGSYNDGASEFGHFKSQEIVIYDQDQSENRQLIENNFADYYSLFAPIPVASNSSSIKRFIRRKAVLKTKTVAKLDLNENQVIDFEDLVTNMNRLRKAEFLTATDHNLSLEELSQVDVDDNNTFNNDDEDLIRSTLALNSSFNYINDIIDTAPLNRRGEINLKAARKFINRFKRQRRKFKRLSASGELTSLPDSTSIYDCNEDNVIDKSDKLCAIDFIRESLELKYSEKRVRKFLKQRKFR